jgi:tetratricopeptide (TPR) repeat protein
MLESLLQAKSIPSDLKYFVQSKAEGNPFYLEELINSLIESETLIRDNDNWKITKPLTESNISVSIHGLISGRLDRLEKETKRILQEASVIGRVFLYEILKRITELKDGMDKSVRILERLDLIRARSLQPELEYIFKHALTQEVVYNGLLKKERREIHERIGLVIEILFHDRLSEFYEILAFHFKHGRTVSKAIDYLIKSGEKSLKRYAVDESHQYYKEAYEILTGTVGLSLESKKHLIRLLIEWAIVFYYRGDFKGLNELFSSHVDLATDIDDDETAGMFFAWLGFTVFFRGEVKASYKYLLKALELGVKTDNQHVIGYACTWLPFTCATLGFLDEAIAYGERAQRISKILPSDHYLFFKSLTGLGFTYWCKGDGKKALKAGKTLLDYGELHSNLRSTVMGHWILGQGHLAKGDFQLAIDSFKRGVQVAKDPWYSMCAKHFLGMSYILSEQFDKAEYVIKDVLTYGQTYGCELFGNMNIGFQGVVMVVQGHMSKGVVQLEEALRTFRNKECKGVYGIFEHILGKIYSQIATGAKPAFSVMAKNIGFLVKAVPLAGKKTEEHFKKAIEISKEIGAKGPLGAAYLDLGLFYKAKNKNQQALECISKAIKSYEECEAVVFLKQAKEGAESLNTEIVRDLS